MTANNGKGRTGLSCAPPVFLKSTEGPQNLREEEVFEACERLIGIGNTRVCQRLGRVWRIHATDLANRAKLVGKMLRILRINTENGDEEPDITEMNLYHKNPFNSMDENGFEIPTTRLTINNIPVSVSNEDIMHHLRDKLGVIFQSKELEWDKVRRKDRSLCTRWLNGKRTAWINLPPPDKPLPRQTQISNFKATLYYREQPKPAVKCYDCGMEGHRRGSPDCKGKLVVMHEEKGEVIPIITAQSSPPLIPDNNAQESLPVTPRNNVSQDTIFNPPGGNAQSSPTDPDEYNPNTPTLTPVDTLPVSTPSIPENEIMNYAHEASEQSQQAQAKQCNQEASEHSQQTQANQSIQDALAKACSKIASSKRNKQRGKKNFKPYGKTGPKLSAFDSNYIKKIKSNSIQKLQGQKKQSTLLEMHASDQTVRTTKRCFTQSPSADHVTGQRAQRPRTDEM